MATLETATEIETTPLQWGSDAPRGGQAVFRRILKDGSRESKVPESRRTKLIEPH